MRKTPTILIGKTIRHISRLRGGGSALPGLIVEKLDRSFLVHSLSQLPKGVVIISGTNGKTTTTKMVVELLQSQGLRVLTNASGSNFSRGVISSVIEKSTLRGRLHFDIAVLELDEAHAVHFVKKVSPSYCLLLNVMRDQLDRFGEIDTTARMLEKIARATIKKVIVNYEDNRLRNIAQKLPKDHVEFFGLSQDMRQHFPSDDELYRASRSHNEPTKSPVFSVTLQALTAHEAGFLINGQSHSTSLQLKGIYNVFNAAGAIALVRAVIGESLDVDSILNTLSQSTPAFGRGETITIHDQPLEIVLVKNPNGFRLGLSSFSAENVATMIVINDNYADGRDMSWLWDVSFSSLQAGVRMVSGQRAHDMALRLCYDEVACDFVEPDIEQALDIFINETSRPKRIYCTYTAMLTIRKILSRYTKMEKVL